MLLIFLQLFSPIFSIKCIRQQGFIEARRVENYTIGSCRGDFCYYFKSDEDIMDRDCFSGFNYPVGCHTYPGKGTLCICNTNNCNKGSIDRNHTMPSVWCSVFSEVFNDHFHDHSLVNALARKSHPICIVNGEIVLDDDQKVTTLKLSGTIPDPHFSYHTDATPLPVGNQPDLIWSFTYNGGFYALQKDPNTISYFGRCTNNYCNYFTFSYIPRNGTKCVLPNGGECEGTFCVYAKGETDLIQKETHQIDGQSVTSHFLVGTQTKSAQYCLSQNASNAEFPILPGIYKFRRVIFYVCDENYCNFDETTAILATQNTTNTYQSGLEKGLTRVISRPSMPPPPSILGDGNWTVPTSGYVDEEENRKV
ncbi:unnamed protein product, partial [Mesorhabditis belari]|uniref:Uncharacterized protein n=1 Tax=Mesorhabditis belari TaxID=2138241 RepID=A0AAF3FEP0_9BILA